MFMDHGEMLRQLRAALAALENDVNNHAARKAKEIEDYRTRLRAWVREQMKKDGVLSKERFGKALMGKNQYAQLCNLKAPMVPEYLEGETRTWEERLRRLRERVALLESMPVDKKRKPFRFRPEQWRRYLQGEGGYWA